MKTRRDSHPGEIDWADVLQRQADLCARDGSPLYAALLSAAARDAGAGGTTARLFADWPGHPFLDAPAMALLGAVHALVLDGRLPELAAFYPSAGGDPGRAGAETAFLIALASHFDEVRAALDRPVQTNEVRRSAALLPGFLEIARRQGLPLRLLEIGSSAGLNLLFDRFRYRLGPHRWGDPDSPVLLESDWEGPSPALDAPLRVAARRGCDPRPSDVTRPEALRHLESFLWADQPERLDRLRAAAALARETPPRLERQGAADFLERQLAEPAPGRTTVVFHSIMWLYVVPEEQRRIQACIEASGRRLEGDRGLAWLRLEGVDPVWAELRLRLWPGEEEWLLARSRYHGQQIVWSPRREA